MKNIIKWFGIIVFFTVIGFSFTGCDLLNNNKTDGNNNRNVE